MTDARLSTTRLTVTTDADGGYRLEGIDPSRQYTLSVVVGDQAPHYPEPPQFTRPGEVIRRDLRLKNAVELSGRVTINDAPAGGARIEWRFDDDRAGVGFTRDDGSYQLKLSDSGELTLRIVESSSHAVTERHVTVTDGVDNRLDIPLYIETRRIAGIVQDARGTPVQGAAVTVHSVGMSQLRTTTDAAGQFEMQIPVGIDAELRIFAMAPSIRVVSAVGRFGSADHIVLKPQ